MWTQKQGFPPFVTTVVQHVLHTVPKSGHSGEEGVIYEVQRLIKSWIIYWCYEIKLFKDVPLFLDPLLNGALIQLSLYIPTRDIF